MVHLFGVQAVQRRSCTACTTGLANECSFSRRRKIAAFLQCCYLTVLYPHELYSISDAYGLKTVQENALL
jgi:hypothetical protein